jgi:hypothetical protein
MDSNSWSYNITYVHIISINGSCTSACDLKRSVGCKIALDFYTLLQLCVYICIEFQQALTKNSDVFETIKLEIEKVNLFLVNISFVLITFA